MLRAVLRLRKSTILLNCRFSLVLVLAQEQVLVLIHQKELGL
jgi:hypothetical protein